VPIPADVARSPGYRQAVKILYLLLALTVVGVCGLRLVTGAGWIDCLYMTVITLSTVGYEDPVHLGPAGKLFISGYLVCGLGVFTYSAFTLGQWLVSAELQRYWERRRMDQVIGGLKGHYIVCGFGRVGRYVCNELASQKVPFVVIERSPEGLAACSEKGYFHLPGDATDDKVLREAGIQRAAAVAAVLPDDADNVYIALSARMISDDVRIVARASDERVAEKLHRAGADRIVSPIASGATKIARFLLNPNMEDFLDIAAGRGEELELADVQVSEGSSYVGRRLDETDLRRRGIIVLCIRRADGSRLVPPPRDAEIRARDLLFLFGAAPAVKEVVRDMKPR
jgi:voltage-gated potassium channel